MCRNGIEKLLCYRFDESRGEYRVVGAKEIPEEAKSVFVERYFVGDEELED